jgi:pimeloyl-ACP methyl ester carboxylesterase
MKLFWLLPMLLMAAACLQADGPQDNIPTKVRPIPPAGIPLAEADRIILQSQVAIFGKEIDELRVVLINKPALLDLLPDVQVYHNAVRYALTYDEFFSPKEVAVARQLLDEGMRRAAQLRTGKPAWPTQTGLVVRGYVSKIDGSVQPYGLVVPASYRPDYPYRYRCDFWCHGRGEKLTELNFIDGRQKSPGEFTPKDAFVVHLYGRYCNANRFAGEVDLFEVLEDMKKRYRIDEDRLVIRGFSMGGAACWHFAVHHPTRWAAAAPGAGFSETFNFLKNFQKETLQPKEYERKLWHLYDATDYAVNLFNCPTVAYSGEIDSQKQAADQMAAAMERVGLSLTHVIGPKTGHRYHPAARDEINRRIDSIVGKGRQRVPPHTRFTTFTLRYNQSAWVRVDGLGRHWEQATVEAFVANRYAMRVTTENITALTLTMPAGYCPLENTPEHGRPKLTVDGGTFAASLLPPVRSDRSWEVHLRKDENGWAVVKRNDDTLHKRHGLQGPIDDAFMDSFLMVRPTGQTLNEKVGAWAKREMDHAITHWRKQFRGEARVKNDADVTAEDIAAHNLVLWGDPQSNKVLAKITERLPIRWNGNGVTLGPKVYDAGRFVPVLIYPNPLNPELYVVLNSGFTFREYDYLNNARQVPKLPDFAVIDVTVPATTQAPGGVVAAGFFDERWQLPKSP